MRVSEQVLLSSLRQGGCVRSFWRRSARLAGTPPPIVPDGLVLETPGERGGTPLCHVDFLGGGERGGWGGKRGHNP
ncbi:hypothetical protein, partial [Salmonella enterica]|uniref:hypothetical protein n=1 Tax=Salmonella enterica TaxID=28901 RepID=UPI0004658643